MNTLMRCPQCKTAKKDMKFCGECGTKLESFADSKNVWKPIGLWRVTTQGDEEGRTTKHLGMHEGHIVDIARQLSGEAFYDLCFDPVTQLDKANVKEPRNQVHIKLGIDSGTWDMTSEIRAAYFRTMTKDRDVTVAPSNYYAAVLFNFPKKEDKSGTANKARR